MPGINVIVHPECSNEVVRAADYVGSTEYIIKALDAAEPGSKWVIGTEPEPGPPPCQPAHRQGSALP
ncbi:hypothetical protein GCM10025876_01990 [Demequina litorisediminis]|uniref:Quinolinate synthase n=1 Tax=Demequina litorisediminis TaxID=1849022 RepID=A0ABQ6I8C1_9MICO|nr:hypothetical protein GCM10025876_01990 [Demequina litorisediminis]